MKQVEHLSKDCDCEFKKKMGSFSCPNADGQIDRQIYVYIVYNAHMHLNLYVYKKLKEINLGASPLLTTAAATSHTHIYISIYSVYVHIGKGKAKPRRCAWRIAFKTGCTNTKQQYLSNFWTTN